MKKNHRRLIAAVLLVVMLLCLTACGKEYQCSRCDKMTTKAYYDPVDADEYFCEQCAREYFAPFPIEGFRVK